MDEFDEEIDMLIVTTVDGLKREVLRMVGKDMYSCEEKIVDLIDGIFIQSKLIISSEEDLAVLYSSVSKAIKENLRDYEKKMQDYAYSLFKAYYERDKASDD